MLTNHIKSKEKKSNLVKEEKKVSTLRFRRRPIFLVCQEFQSHIPDYQTILYILCVWTL